jgi:protein dithiol oxidoreductase (disulfide-forming)
MQRAGLLRGLIPALVLMLATAASAQTVPGSRFTRLDPPQPVQSGPRIEVLEFFYYGCPVCYELQPYMTRWLAQVSADISLRRIPVLSSSAWEPLAKLHYCLEALGESDRLHWPVYDNFHFDGVRLDDEAVMFDWVAHNGIDRDRFTALYRSPQIGARLEEARRLTKAYGVRSVPAVVVDGKYLSSVTMTGSPRQLVQALDDLVRRARLERPASP